MNPLIEKIYQTQTVEDSDGNPINPFPSSISRSKGETLYRLVREWPAHSTLEIGMAYGLSSLFFGQAHVDAGEGGTHVAIDPNQNLGWRSIGLLNLSRAGLDGVCRFIEGPSHVRLPELLESPDRFDLIFIDGSHLFDFVLVDFFYADLLLNEGGCLVFDDLWMPAIRKVLDFILSNRRYEPFDTGNAEGVDRVQVIRKAGGQGRRWDHFVPF